MRYRLLFSFIPFVLSGCNALADRLYGYHPNNEIVYPDLQGHWVSTDPKCQQLCAFTIIDDNQKDKKNMFLIFDDGKWSNITSGPFRRIRGVHYILEDGYDSIPFELKDSALVAYKTVYKRDSTKID